MHIDITLEKRCIKYLWNMINSNCKLYRNIVNLSLNNVSTTIGENLRYFMYKYMIQEYDWCKIPQFKITNERCEYWCISCIVIDTDNLVN